MASVSSTIDIVFDRKCVAYLAKIMACNARIEAVKTANHQREMRGESPAYPSERIEDEADLLENLADELMEGLPDS